MRKTLPGLTLALLALAAASIAPSSGIAQTSNNNSAQETTIVGFISDRVSGVKHMSGMGDDKSCTLACVKGGSKFVLADPEHGRVYQLDKTGQAKARDICRSGSQSYWQAGGTSRRAIC